MADKFGAVGVLILATAAVGVGLYRIAHRASVPPKTKGLDPSHCLPAARAIVEWMNASSAAPGGRRQVVNL